MSKRNAAKGIVAGMYVLTAPMAVTHDLIYCARTKTSPAQLIRNEVDLAEDVLTNPDEYKAFLTRLIKSGKK